MELRVWDDPTRDEVNLYFYEVEDGGKTVRPVTIRFDGMFVLEPNPSGGVMPVTLKLRKEFATRLGRALLNLP